MEKYVAILRGINVGGKRKILMQDLKQLFVSLGFEDVSTYIQSGNVIFIAETEDYFALSEKIERAILDRYGFEVPVIVRSSSELNELVNSNPFAKDPETDTKLLHLTFLKNTLAPGIDQSINAIDFLPEKFEIVSNNVFIKCAAKYSDSKLTNMFFERKLKVQATTRNWNTVLKLAGM